MSTKRDGDGFSKSKETGGEDLFRAKVGDDDVEGHLMRSREDGAEGFSKSKTTGGEDLFRAKTSDEDDVEGHAFRLRSPSSRGE
jgi:hypothetical protein